MAHDPALFREDVKEHAVSSRELRCSAVLEANVETGHVTTGVSPEQGQGLSLDPQMDRHHFPQTARRRRAATFPSIDGSPDREPSATPAHGPVGRSPDRGRADDCRLRNQLVLVAESCAAWRFPDPAKAVNEIHGPMDSQRGKLSRDWAGGTARSCRSAPLPVASAAAEGKEQRYGERDPDQTRGGQEHSPLSSTPLRFCHQRVKRK